MMKVTFTVALDDNYYNCIIKIPNTLIDSVLILFFNFPNTTYNVRANV